jgi:hypothetical protein
MSVRMLCRVNSQRSCSSKAKYPAPYPRIQRPRQNCPDSEAHRADSAFDSWAETLPNRPRHTCPNSRERHHLPTRNPPTSPSEYYVEASRCHSSRRSVARSTKKKVCDLYIHVTRWGCQPASAKPKADSPRFWGGKHLPTWKTKTTQQTVTSYSRVIITCIQFISTKGGAISNTKGA